MKIGTYILAAGLAACSAVSVAGAQERVSIGTGGTGGLFYIIGAGMADVLNAHMEDTTARAEVTGASLENIRRVAAEQLTTGFSSASTLYEAKKGIGAFEGDPQPVAAITFLHPSVLQIATTADTGITSIEELEGKPINLGPPGSNSSVLSTRVLEAYGIFDASNVQYLSYAEGVNALLNGSIAATFTLAGPPVAALVDLDAQRDMVLLSIDESRVQAIIDEYPYYSPGEVRVGTYPDVTESISTINDPGIMFTRETADPELIRTITATLFENTDELYQVHPQAKEMTLERAEEVPIDLHPGAKAYFDSVK